MKNTVLPSSPPFQFNSLAISPVYTKINFMIGLPANQVSILTQRPGKIKMDMEVDLPRPRNDDIWYTSHFDVRPVWVLTSG